MAPIVGRRRSTDRLKLTTKLAVAGVLCVCLLLSIAPRGANYNNVVVVVAKNNSLVLSSPTTTISGAVGTSSLSTTTPPQQRQHKTQQSLLQPVSCATHVVESDPNNGMKQSSHSKYVNKTDPPFWISLHKQYFDKMRWAAIMNRGEYYETGLTEQFKSILQSKLKGLVIDVGMNIGWFTLYSRAMGHDVIGFDPNPIMHSRVCESLGLNEWQDDGSITQMAYGLGDVSGTLNLTMGNNPGGSSFHEHRLAPRFRRYLSVPVTTLDTLAMQYGLIEEEVATTSTTTATSAAKEKKYSTDTALHLLKVDVEGYEPQVFRGATRLLASRMVKSIIMESSSMDLDLIREMFGRLATAGYRLHLISDVNGKPYHPEMIEKVNEAMDGGSLNDSILDFFAKISYNIWWQLQE